MKKRVGIGCIVSNDAGVKPKTDPALVHQNGEPDKAVNDKRDLCEPGPRTVETLAGKAQVSWDFDAAVSRMGEVSYFSEFLKANGLFDSLLENCPLRYASNNAPKPRDVLGTFLLSVLAGHNRYAHISAIRAEQLAAETLGMGKVVSEDSVRSALAKLEEGPASSWLRGELDRCLEPMLSQRWILDVDTTVKTLYGKQQGARVGYNPHKPGRPSHAYHCFWVAGIRVFIGMKVLPGNESSGSYALEDLLEWIASQPEGNRPELVRGDCGFGSDAWMGSLESIGMKYLFRLRMSKKVKDLVAELESPALWEEAAPAWEDDGDGWSCLERPLQLSSWKSPRRAVVCRRVVGPGEGPLALSNGAGEQMALEVVDDRQVRFEYRVHVTNLDWPRSSIRPLYQDRADNENCYDELKNQWGWGGYNTRDLKRSRIAAQLVGLVYNWWSLFVKLVEQGDSREAITSRPLMLGSVARSSNRQRQRLVRLSPFHAEGRKYARKLNEASAFLCGLISTAEQLSCPQRWKRIVERTFEKIWVTPPSIGPPQALSG